MSEMSKQLLARAEEIRLASPEEYAVEMLKQAGMAEDDARVEVAQLQMEKAAANELASSSGIDIEQAVILVKAAGANVKDMEGFKIEKPEIDPTIELLQKAAAYIETLEAEKADFEKEAEELKIQEIKLPKPIEKAASSGMFTFEDLAALKTMDQELLNKVASVSDEPWEMGRGAGMARPKTDHMLEWILS